MFNWIKDRFTENGVLSERLRTLLYLSKHLKRPISVLLIKPDQKISQCVVKSGVVTAIINGSAGTQTHQRYIGGQFSLGLKDQNGQDVWFAFSDVYAVSLGNECNPEVFLKRENTVNVTQHLRPFTGFGPDSETNESYYYRLLSLIAGA